MSIRAQSQAEPIPGYKLIERIGGGGFGEVWKCEAPGGLLKAIKFVHGTMQGSHGDGALMQQELKSLNRVKSVRHPYILSLERYDIVDGQLVIVMELADRNLWDRFLEAQKQGNRGIPREELLRYMEEAAEALDLMNVQYQLQHLDIKPQNLFLVHNHIKVADFGLVKDLEGMNTQVTSGVTPLYAAPETFEGMVSRYSDQYNLAIVYQELLTGQRPFTGTNVRQLLMQHLTGEPDLKPLPECDRPAIARSLSKKPEDRFPTCSDLIRALRQGGQPQPTPPPAPLPAFVEHAVIETPAVIRVSPTARAEKPVIAPEDRPTPMTVAPAEPMMTVARRSAVIERGAVPVPPREETTGDGTLFPALVIGLGRLGRAVLEQLRGGLLERCGPAEALPHLRLLYIDADPESMPQVSGESLLGDGDVLLTRLNKPSHYLRPVRNRASLDSWLNLSMVCRIPRNQTTPEGLRILGRLALVDNYRSVVSRLRSDLDAVTNPKSLTAADRQTRLGVRTTRPRVYVVAGMGGGTGSGMFLDVAYVARNVLAKLGYQKFELVGVCLLPSAGRAAQKSPVLGNTFAALTELNHFSSPEVTYQAFFDDQADPISDKNAPFERCIMLQLPEEGAGPTGGRDLTALAGDIICRELVTPLGRKLDEAREELKLQNPDEPGFLCQTFGAYRYAMPRRVLMEQVGRALVRRLVQNWLTGERLAMQRAVKARVTEQWSKVELQPEALIALFQSACERSVGQPPEVQCEAILQRAASGGEIPASAALSALAQFEQLVGRPGDENSATPVGNALAEAARVIRRDCEQKVADVLSALVEDPRFRIFGGEEAVQQVAGILGEAVRTYRAMAQDLDGRAADAHTHIHALLVNLQKGSWWPGKKAKTAQELRESLQQFPRTRFQALVVQHVADVYQGLMEGFAKRQEEMNFCRARLADFQRGLDNMALAGRTKIELGPGRHFLPANCRTVDDAIDTLVRSVKPEDLLDLDQKLQGVIRRQFKSLFQLCHSTNPHAFQELQSAMQQECEAHVEGLIGKASVAAMYLKERSSDAEIVADLTRAFEEAAPALVGPRNTTAELRLLAVPADLAGERLGKLARSISREVEVVSAPGVEDVLFYREQPQLPLADLPQLGLMAEEIYRQMTAAGSFTPHTRMDVLDWLQAT